MMQFIAESNRTEQICQHIFMANLAYFISIICFIFSVYILAQATGDVCDLPQVIGTGPYRIPRWYFNPNTRRCELFYYRYTK